MEKGGGQLVDAPSFVDLCTLHQHAMRYYRLCGHSTCFDPTYQFPLIHSYNRLWIYACNTVIGVSTFSFTLFALFIVIDPRTSLISGVHFYDPTFIYAYFAIVLQCGVFQAIGCIGALRLNAKLLNTYWTILLVLMIGDIFVGLIWTFRLVKIKAELIPELKQRLNTEYGNEGKFTPVWDWVQRHDVCCGVAGPVDFLHLNESSGNQLDSNGLPFDISSGLHPPKFPSSCCEFIISYHDDPSSVSLPTTSHHPLPTTKLPHRTHRTKIPHYPNNNFTNYLNSFSSLSGLHNRRTKVHKGKDEGHLLKQHTPTSQNNVQTTTEGSNRKGSLFGVCSLPPSLSKKHGKYIYIKISDTIVDGYSFEGSGGGGSFEGEEGSTELPQSSTFSTESTWGGASSGSDTIRPPYVVVSMTLNSEGCGEKVLMWLDHSSDVLFVIGFCIIGFVKGCFVAILKYEITEMIQKIKLLNGEDDGRTAAMNELIGLTSMYDRSNQEERAEDPGEREGLMASTGDAPGSHTANTNIDAIESADKRKDSVISRDHNCLPGNNVGNHRGKSQIVGNHITLNMGNNNPGVGCSSSSIRNKQDDVEEDFDSGSALLGRKFKNEVGGDGSGRNHPRNGNNNIPVVGGVTSSASAPVPIEHMAKA